MNAKTSGWVGYIKISVSVGIISIIGWFFSLFAFPEDIGFYISMICSFGLVGGSIGAAYSIWKDKKHLSTTAGFNDITIQNPVILWLFIYCSIFIYAIYYLRNRGTLNTDKPDTDQSDFFSNVPAKEETNEKYTNNNDFIHDTNDVMDENSASRKAPDKIRELKELHEEEVLTDDEFEKKKSELLEDY